MSTEGGPPVAKRAVERLEVHGHVREDPYYWLNRRDDAEVIDYLEQENAYTQRVMAHTEGLQQELFEEIKGRLVPDDSSVPYRKGDFFYYSRFREGAEYAIHCRKARSLDADETILVDGNVLAEGHDYFSLRLSGVSPSHRKLAYAVDTQGRRIYDVFFKDLTSGALLDDRLTAVTGSLAWASDDATVFYTRQHPETLRAYQVYRHRLGTQQEDDVLVFEEADDTFNVDVLETRSERFIVIASEQTVSSEYWFVDAERPEEPFTVIAPRQREHEYSVSHLGDNFYILTNEGAQNFKLVRAPVSTPGREHWEDVIPHRPEVLLEGFVLFRDHLVVVERHDGLRRIRVRRWDGGGEHYLDFEEETYFAFTTQNVEIDSSVLRFGYTSLTSPRSIYDYDMETRNKTLLKQDEVRGGFDPTNYRAERLHASAPDGTRVPISLVKHKDTPAQAPVVLYGYGSYGISIDATFSAPRLSLLDRGFVFAIAHIRGGEDMGRPWYDHGKLLEKKNTFTDFIACGAHLVAAKAAHPDKLYAWGGSAGGLLVGAVINMRPDLFAGAVAEVPFVDVVTTMLDTSIPLTTGEFDEWGNPAEKPFYDLMLSYSPYDNVEAKDYPHLLVTAGLHDSQVQYWEPAKWVAKLRAAKTDDRRLLLKTNMEAGHGGASGRYRRHRETALVFAFLLDLANRSD